ncbi:glycosyltransferase family 2 protein [Alicyclobacillus mengziensis]|uniref:4,4'-diaponeurosporenoate glycosyltransferase n=1 Tax=Alicyclobacillus mengziensis TaxID=2931921 RepID=A0A9X7W1S0_9BACL|nr:glycosyltransferase [Alicyclobacillus mengziensis]QSO48892.1 glycosyltransferase [Alicyclobacillus mengziensis]
MWYWLFGAIVLLAWVILGIRNVPGLLRSVSLNPTDRHHSRIRDASRNTLPPRVSVLIAARNEAKALPATLASLRAQTWLDMEVIAVNDRSTDETGDVLNLAAASWASLRVIHITELPEGWLGKNHALKQASELASGDWLLFTDADVCFHKDAVETAMRYALANDIDHLAVAPAIRAKGFWLRTAVFMFLYNVVLVFKPQDADRPKASAFVGIGAFNLVRKTTYEAVGGHKSVARRPDDDLALGAVIKRSGFRQCFAGGTNLLEVEWYHSLREMTHGLEKNALAPFQYRFWKFTLGVLLMLLVYDGPAAGIIVAWGLHRLLFVTAFAVEVYLFRLTRTYSGVSTWWAFTLPVSAPVLFFILVRSALLCLVRGGILWRGTFYSLKELRKAT